MRAPLTGALIPLGKGLVRGFVGNLRRVQVLN